MATFKQMFPEVTEVQMPPVMAGQSSPGKSELNNYRRQQLADLAAAYGIAVDPDATKDELLPVLIAAEKSGRFQKPAKDPYRLNKAARSADEWAMVKNFGVPRPPFEEPDAERVDPNSFKALQQRIKALGRGRLGQTKDEMLAILAEHEGQS